MAYLHANKPKPLLHRDLTSHNILLDRNLITKVADFGLSHVKQDASNKTYGIGQIPWMAPEGVCVCVCVWCRYGVVSCVG
jgi:serine/threonine protein kinase